MNEGISLEETAILTNAPFKSIGSPKKIIGLFGGNAQYQAAVRELQNHLYAMPSGFNSQPAQTGNQAGRYV